MTNLVFAPPALGTVLSLTGLPGGSNKIYDRSPYGNIGTIVGATWVRLPSGLWVLSFDGSDDKIDCGTGASLRLSTAMTVCLWANITSLANLNTYISKYDNDNVVGRCWYMNSGSGVVGYRFAVQNVSDSKVTLFYGSEGDAPEGVWQFLCGTYSASTELISFYINGALKETAAQTGNIKDIAALKVYVGAMYDDSDDPTQKINGKIGLPRIYNRALSALEIQNHFNQEKHLFGVW